MKSKRPRPALLEVSAADIEHLSDVQLIDLMGRLLAAEAAVIGLPAAQAIVSSEPKATDDGEDGHTGAHKVAGSFLPAEPTCWQFKAGTAGSPGELKGEVTKKNPRATLKASGAYVVVCSAAKGSALAKRRKEIIVKEAKKAKLPTDKIHVYEAETLAKWCTQRLGVALYILGTLPFCLTPALWKKGSKLLTGPYVEDDKLKAALAQVRTGLDPNTGAVLHVHVEGLPGVGKTRFALQAIEGAVWKELAVCFDGTDNTKASELLADLGLDGNRRGVIVVDEASAEHVEHLNNAVQRCDGRVRLLTIGTERRKTGSESALISLPRLNDVDMAKVVAGRHTKLTREQVDFCAKQADGYVKFADVLGNAIARNPSADLATFFDDENVTHSLTELLEGVDPHALSMIALFRSLGWSKGAERELQIVAKHLGLKVANVRKAADDAHRRFGICPTAGSRRYISPEPLANYLATEAWRTHESAIHELPDLLRGTPAFDAFFVRLRTLATFPAARPFAQKELDRFFQLTTLNDERAARVWSIVSAADPLRAVKTLRKALESDDADVRGFAGRPRREVVWALERLAWPKETFEDAMWCLLWLAMGENEDYSNNATGVFVQHFVPVLSGTEVPFADRLHFLDLILSSKHLIAQRLGLLALDAALTTNGHRTGIDEVDGRPLPPEWQPTLDELTECRRLAIVRIGALVEGGVGELRDELLRIFRENFWPMSSEGLVEEMAALARKLVGRIPDVKEDVRRTVASTIGLLERSKRDDALRARLEALHDEFVDQSFTGRMKQFLASPPYLVKEPTPEVIELAREVTEDPTRLDANREWLTSADAQGAWLLGAALADNDQSEDRLPHLIQFAGRGEGVTILSAYLFRRHKERGVGWLEDRIDEIAAGDAARRELALELTARMPAGVRGAERAIRILDAGGVPEGRFSALAFGPWATEAPVDALKRLVTKFPRREPFSVIGAVMLGARVSRDDGSGTALEDLLVDYATRPEVILGGGTTVEYQWQQMAKQLAPKHARELAAAIFVCQMQRDGWFIEHHGANEVLALCAQTDPQAVWLSLAPHLESDDAELFTIGFPDSVVAHLPIDDVLAWIEQDIEHRGLVIARLLPGIGDDASLGARLADRFGHVDAVGSALLSSLIAGTAWGPLSARFDGEAAAIEKVLAETKLAGLRRFAKKAAEALRAMAAHERDREAEREIRR